MDKDTSKVAGGEARSAALSPKKRSEIAKKAADARWNKSEKPLPEGVRRASYGSPDKMLEIGDVNVECYVLEDGIRVLSGRGMQSAIGFGGAASSHGTKLRNFINSDQIKPYVNNDLAMAFSEPVRFIRPGRGGVPAIAFEATLLIDLCETILKFANDNGVKKAWAPLVLQAQTITLSFAKAGIISAVDEVTGYQQVRERDAIQKIVDKYITDYRNKWTKKFPDEFWDKLLKAKGYESYIGMGRPQFVGHWVNDIVYSRMAPGILKKMKELNPRPEGKKSRRYKNHDFLTTDFGVPSFNQHMIKVDALMDFSIASGQDFDLVLNKTLPKYGDTIELALDDPNI